MPTCYTEWTVLPHKPIVRLSDRLWTVEGKMSNGVKRIMTMIRLDDGRVLLHNAVALDESEMAELDAWGEVAGILVPNAFHRLDCRIMQARYPDAKVYAPAGAIKAVAKATPVHGTFADAPLRRRAHLPDSWAWRGADRRRGGAAARDDRPVVGETQRAAGEAQAS